MKKTASYQIVYQELKSKIKDGFYPVGTLLPTESELESMFQVSRTTIRKAVNMLTLEHYLEVKQGYGTTILNPSTSQKLNCITSISETLAAKGYHVSTKGISLERIPASEKIARIFHLKTGQPVYHLQRVQYTDGSPIALISNYLKLSEFPDLEKHLPLEKGLYHLLETEYYTVFKEADEKISAICANFTESQILQVPLNSPLLCSKRITYSENGAFEYVISKLIADKYEYSVHLEGRL